MNTTRNLRLLGALIVASLFFVARISAAPIGLWNFDSSNLVATVGADLAYTDGGGGATAAATVFGTTAGFGITNINGTNAKPFTIVASTPVADLTTDGRADFSALSLWAATWLN